MWSAKAAIMMPMSVNFSFALYVFDQYLYVLHACVLMLRHLRSHSKMLHSLWHYVIAVAPAAMTMLLFSTA